MQLSLAPFYNVILEGKSELVSRMHYKYYWNNISSIYILHFYKQQWWYDTMICFPLGMYFSIYKHHVENFLMRSKFEWTYWSSLVFFIWLISIFGKYKNNFYIYELWMISFTLVIVLLTMKIDFKSSVLQWMGDYLSEIYILMRIPMELFQPVFSGQHNYRYLLLCIICLYPMVVIFRKSLKYIDSVLRL